MTITFTIPESVHDHAVTGALVLEAQESKLHGEDLLEIDGKIGTKVILLLTPHEQGGVDAYAAFDFDGTAWNQIELPIYQFSELHLEPLSVEDTLRRF